MGPAGFCTWCRGNRSRHEWAGIATDPATLCTLGQLWSAAPQHRGNTEMPAAHTCRAALSGCGTFQMDCLTGWWGLLAVM